MDWVKGLFNGDIKPEFTHDIDTTFTAILVKEQWGPCKVKGADVQANLLAQAKTHVKVSTSFGLTIITKLGTPLDLSQSYLYFKNKGEVSAIFTLDAVGRAKFETGDKELLGLQNFPGATFGIPKLLTVGPNFKLFGAVEASVTLAGHLESRVDIAKWDVQQTYPDQGADAGPKALSDPSRDGTGDFEGLKQPSFDYSITTKGEITAHLKPTFEFGIVFDKMWKVGDAKVAVVADGWTRLMAAAGVSSQGNCPFTYGIDLGADLYATVEAPEAFGWKPSRLPIAAVKPVAAKEGGTCPQIEKRSLGAVHYVEDLSLVEVSPRYLAGVQSTNDSIGHQWGKRGEVFGEFFPTMLITKILRGPALSSTVADSLEAHLLSFHHLVSSVLQRPMRRLNARKASMSLIILMIQDVCRGEIFQDFWNIISMRSELRRRLHFVPANWRLYPPSTIPLVILSRNRQVSKLTGTKILTTVTIMTLR